MNYKKIQYDLYRFRGKVNNRLFIFTLFTNRIFRRVFYYRKYQESGKIGKAVIRFFTYFLNRKMSVELPWNAKIGKGVLFLHPFSVTLNSKCVIGDNCTIMKGVTIGNTKGANAGVPTIGDNVYLGVNSTIVGNIHIGNDVLIAPNSFVNFDVPDGAIVLGNPGVIHRRERGSAVYIVNDINNIKI